MNWALNLHIMSDPKLCIHYSQVFDEQFMKKNKNKKKTQTEQNKPKH